MREPKDSKYREMIVRDLHVSTLVEAGAGSGKTTSLVERMLALVGSGLCTVDRMAAVTFTRKAAAELCGRFQIRLEEALQTVEDDQTRSRYRAALDKLELLFAGTIHSFCAHLLRERPVEARLDPDFRELEENENALLRDKCWTEYLERLHVKNEPILSELMELGVNPAELIGTYQNVALYPEVEVSREKLKRPDFGKEKELLKEYLQEASKALPEVVPDKGWDGLQRLLRQARLRCRHSDLEKDPDFVKILSGLDKSPRVTQNRWPSKDVAKEQSAYFDKFKQEVVAPSLDLWRHYCHHFITQLVEPGVKYFREYRAKNSIMNFHDLLVRAAGLLKNNPEVRGYFQRRFTHVLVDEFQDTDPVQAEVILYLTGEDLEEKSWHRLTVRPGSLFIVGDPKQSIYRFRRADIDTYNQVKEIVKNSGGHIVPLTANFRSLPAVCEWVNPIFEQKFPTEGTQYQPAFERLNPFRETDSGGVKRITINKVARHNQREIARQDAERISDWISWALDGNFEVSRTEDEIEDGKGAQASPGDFMILLRYRAHLHIYARALEARDIPYEVTGGASFGESEEIWHLLNLLTAVAEPKDQVALVATLRGQFFGVSDDLLYRFRSQGGVFSYLTPEDGCKDGEAREQIGGIFAELKQFHRWSRTRPPGATLSLIMDRLGIVPLALTREMGQSRAGNLLKALDLTLWESNRSLPSFADTVERLTEYFTELDVEEMSVEPGKKDAVRVMNLHKAKGLEANVVFLADPIKETVRPPQTHITRKGETATGHFVASCRRGEYQTEVVGLPPNWREREALEVEYQAAEGDRLLYVATTRARQLLVVSKYPEKSDKGAWKDLYPFLADVEELEMPGKKIEAVDWGTVTTEEFEAARKQIAEKISECKRPSYTTETVTAASKAPPGGVPFAQDSDRGMSWGRIIHRVLEALVRDEGIDLNLMAENLLKGEERPLSERDMVVSTVNVVISSDLWGRMKKAEEVFVEVPFSVRTERDVVPKIVSGVLDLVFREPDGWVIADYKTDKVDGNLESLATYYKPQVETYRKFWQEISGEEVKEAGLYFIDSGEWVTV